jgi:hypothetical protein
MHTGREPLLIGDPPEQATQRLALIRRERRARCVVVFSGDLSDVLESRSALASQMERIDSTILGAATALDQVALLQLIDEEYQSARWKTEHRAQGLLADARAGADEAKRACMGRSETERGQPLSELACRVGAYLRQ